uniref:Exonuclease domain-containing protein n=1 Tax=Timema shepardi TaxID=629360 RepID=A0A7R9ATZ1_TIMSH|nr:unnamed protein product [Timema shepardi]
MAQEAMSHPPMEEHLLPSSGQRHRVVCYDLETTGLELVDEIIQIGGSVDQARIFSKYIVPATRRVHPDAARIIGLQVVDGGKGLKDLRDNSLVDAVDEGSGLEEFLHWLEEVRGDVDRIILASHGAIFLDIPVLLIALRRRNLTDRFKQIVSGFCDTYAIFQADLKIRKYTLQSLYEQFIGRRPEKHRAPEDARDLHTILTTYFKTTQLSMDLPPLARATYTVKCMEEYVSWRESTEPHRADLMTITASWNVRGEKLKKVLVKNLLAAGYTYKRLADEYRMYGDQKFKNSLEQSILHMKRTYESYLTDTKDMSARVVADRVLEHFKSCLRNEVGADVVGSGGSIHARPIREGPQARPYAVHNLFKAIPAAPFARMHLQVPDLTNTSFNSGPVSSVEGPPRAWVGTNCHIYDAIAKEIICGHNVGVLPPSVAEPGCNVTVDRVRHVPETS